MSLSRFANCESERVGISWRCRRRGSSMGRSSSSFTFIASYKAESSAKSGTILWWRWCDVVIALALCVLHESVTFSPSTFRLCDLCRRYDSIRSNRLPMVSWHSAHTWRWLCCAVWVVLACLSALVCLFWLWIVFVSFSALSFSSSTSTSSSLSSLSNV